LGDAVTNADRAAREQREPVEFIRVGRVTLARARGEPAGEQRYADELLTPAAGLERARHEPHPTTPCGSGDALEADALARAK
jgi:hypothetical protein